MAAAAISPARLGQTTRSAQRLAFDPRNLPKGGAEGFQWREDMKLHRHKGG